MGLIRTLRSCCTVSDHHDTIDIPEEDIYRILSSRRRRLVTVALDDRDGQVTVSELSRAVAAAETGAEPFGVGEDVYRRCYISVYQTHVPTLADSGVIAWDRDRGTVEPREPIEPLADIVRDIRSRVDDTDRL